MRKFNLLCYSLTLKDLGDHPEFRDGRLTRVGSSVLMSLDVSLTASFRVNGQTSAMLCTSLGQSSHDSATAVSVISGQRIPCQRKHCFSAGLFFDLLSPTFQPLSAGKAKAPPGRPLAQGELLPSEMIRKARRFMGGEDVSSGMTTRLRDLWSRA